MLFGVLQGYIIAYLNVPAFIVTLGGMFVLNGLILLVTQGKTILANQPHFRNRAGYLPPLAGWIIAGIVVAFLFWNMFRSRQLARHGFELPNLALELGQPSSSSLLVIVILYWVISIAAFRRRAAAGDYRHHWRRRLQQYALWLLCLCHRRQSQAARLSGINIRRSIFPIFILMGLLSGSPGIVLASYVITARTAAGQGYGAGRHCQRHPRWYVDIGRRWHRIWCAHRLADHVESDHRSVMLNVARPGSIWSRAALLVLAVYADVYFKRNR